MKIAITPEELHALIDNLKGLNFSASLPHPAAGSYSAGSAEDKFCDCRTEIGRHINVQHDFRDTLVNYLTAVTETFVNDDTSGVAAGAGVDDM